ncbi:MAG: hypothetical protein PQJ50_04020 [Spirochaetales bacterium]|nr:hypothetical protein [Spirochaetales bacterium]
MSDRKELFLKVFKMELEEIRTDIALLSKLYLERYESREITQYVQRENRALLEHEIHCLEKLVPELDNFASNEYPDMDSFVNGLKVFLKAYVEEHQYPKAVYLLAERKLQKVEKYIY